MLKGKFCDLQYWHCFMIMSFTATANGTGDGEDTVLNFGVFSDIHNRTSYMKNVTNNIETLANGNENVDGIVMVGDIAYIDVCDIDANELGDVRTVTVTDKNNITVRVEFNAIAYVELCLDKDDVRLLNLAKSLYRYYVTAYDYYTDGKVMPDENESNTMIW